MIAPAVDLLYVPGEVSDVVNYLNPTLLQGDVKKRDVIKALHGDHNIVWFATHCDSDGLHLSDGVMTAAELTQAIKNSPSARGLYLNTCEGLMVAAEVHSETGIQVICTPVGPAGQLDDESAAITGHHIAYRLSKGHTFQEAFGHAGSDSYLMLGSAFPLHHRDHERIDYRIAVIEREIASVRNAVVGVKPMMWWLAGVASFMFFVLLTALLVVGAGPAWYHPASGIVISATISVFCLTKGLGYRFKI